MTLITRTDKYIFVQTLAGVAVAAGAACLAIILVDLVEQLRNVADIPGGGTGLALIFTLMRTPSILEQALPFAVLVGAIVTFMRLSRSSEVVAMRASGISTWRILSPVAVLAALIGILTALVLGPVASRLNASYENQQQALLGATSTQSGIGENKMTWRRDRGPNAHYTISYRTRDTQYYRDVTLYTFSLTDAAFLARYDAKTAQRQADAWVLNDVIESRVGTQPRISTQLKLDLSKDAQPTTDQSNERSARATPVWALPAAAYAAAQNGGSPQRYWLQFHRKISQPVTLLAMAMIAAVLSLSTNRVGGRAIMVAAAIASGLVIYFVNDLSGALATSGYAPSWVAAWAPPLTALFIAMATVSFREDG